MFELFVVGTFWFWLLLVAEIVLLFVFVEYENGIGATISVLAFGALLQMFGNVDIIQYLRANPIFVLSCAAAYFACGAVWGIIKWWIFCHDKLETYQEKRDAFFREHNVDSSTKVVPPELRERWKRVVESVQQDYRNGDKEFGKPPQVRTHKAQIMRWMSFWVISMVWSFINDFVKRVFRTIYQRLAAFLQRISDNLFGSIKEDFANDE